MTKKVDAGYNWQWGRQVQVDEQMLALMKANGYEAQHTGGGCMAWEKPLADGGYLMITDGDSGLGDWDEAEDRTWYVARFHEDGEAWTDHEDGAYLTLTDAIAIGETLPEPEADPNDAAVADIKAHAALWDAPAKPPRLATLDTLIATYEAWLADPAQAPIRDIEGDAEELILHVSEMCLTTREGDEERALHPGATMLKAEVWRGWLSAFIALWEATQ